MRKPRSGRARPPGGNWRVCRSFLRHLGKENVAKNAKCSKDCPLRLCHALYWTTVHDRISLLGTVAILWRRGQPLKMLYDLMRFLGKCDDLTLNL